MIASLLNLRPNGMWQLLFLDDEDVRPLALTLAAKERVGT
jgi:hypothetical protein